MHENLERRFIRLATAQSSFFVALEAFKVRYHLLFAALAEDRGWSVQELAKRVGFDPCPPEGNAITNGKAEPHASDALRLMEVYLATLEPKEQVNGR